MKGNCEIGQCIWSDRGKFCDILDDAGVPVDGKWPMLILFLRGIKDACYLSEVQKAHMQELLVEVLQKKEFSQASLDAAHLRAFRIITMKLDEKLNEIAQETSRLAKDVHALFGKHRQEVTSIAEQVDEDLAKGVEPASVLAELRDALKDVATQMEMDNNTLAALSHKDGLTGLDNRRSFDAFLEEAVARWQKHGEPLSLIMFDIDHFKQFNDTYGHLAGDQVLRTLAARLRTILEPLENSDSQLLAARYGGEEFAVVLQGRIAAKAVNVAETIRKTVQKASLLLRDSTNNVLERKLKITVSLGVASAWSGWPGAYQMNLIDYADKCLYQAKRSGRNCTVQYMPGNDDIYRVVPA